MAKIQVNADSVEELIDILQQLVSAAGSGASAPIARAAAEGPHGGPASAEVATTPNRGRGRPRRAIDVPQPAQPEAAPTAAPFDAMAAGSVAQTAAAVTPPATLPPVNPGQGPAVAPNPFTAPPAAAAAPAVTQQYRPIVQKALGALDELAKQHGAEAVYSWAITRALQLPPETTADAFKAQVIHTLGDDVLEKLYAAAGGQ